MRKQLYIIAYDISDDKSRGRVADLLETAGGGRINRSVFECMLTLKHKKQLLKQIEQHIDTNTDIVAAYHVCKSCYIQSAYLPEQSPKTKTDIVVL